MARKRLAKDLGADNAGASVRTEAEPRPTEAERRLAAARATRTVDFSAAEREAILRCCLDYRNRMPTYLQSAQRELKVIDSVIEKCRQAPRSSAQKRG
jgi:hypothetical protein